MFIKRMLWELYNGNSDIKEFLDGNIGIFNGAEESAEGLSLLDSLLSEQLFRLSFWKVATEELNYRRFFNINGLISLRVEEERVFNLTHSFVNQQVRKKKFTGLRIDHIDGLYDPTDYLKKLREKNEDMYIAVEKILEFDEKLPSLWAVQGTTGYDFLNYLNGVFCDESNGSQFNKLYYSFTGFKTSYETLLYEKKNLVIQKDMAGDVDNLAHLFKRISSKDRYGNDITLDGIKRAIVEILALFPVYRTYIRPEYYSEADRRYITETIKKAREMNPALLHELNFMERFLLLDFKEYHTEEDKDEWVQFVMRFQQLTGPLMAKGFEDTTLYIYNRLLSLNDVGGSPDRFGATIAEFHDINSKRARIQPHSMNATSTHDTKRGEDVRARINVLSEIPGQWEVNVRTWSKLNRRKKKSMKGVTVPTKNDEYFLYQTLVGALPFYEDEFDSFKARLKDYIIKAVREAKVHTAWLKPDTDYEENFLSFIDKILHPAGTNRFLPEFRFFQKKVAFYGILNSLSQTILKIMSPGFPDFYVGSEFWEFNFVDPDNRRPVDFEKRAWLFREMKDREKNGAPELIQELFATCEDGRIKMFLIYKALASRISCRHVIEKGKYIPLETGGKYKDNIIAFAWKHKPSWVITIAPRFLTRIVEENQYPLGRKIWDDTHIVLPYDAPFLFTEKITGMELKCGDNMFIGDVLKHFSCALLVNKVDS
jgi:(1->4)-alpha-D-glucan 1-alpha-D-glucosylmutase